MVLLWKLGGQYLTNQVHSQYIIRKGVELGFSEERQSSIWWASGLSNGIMIQISSLALCGWMWRMPCFRGLKRNLVQLGLSKLWAVLVSYLKHGKASVYPLCVCETMSASQHDLLQNSAVKFCRILMFDFQVHVFCVLTVYLLRSLLRGERGQKIIRFGYFI